MSTKLQLLKFSIVEHSEFIKKCGRYPHRNHLLGRETTEKDKEMIEKFNLMIKIKNECSL